MFRGCIDGIPHIQLLRLQLPTAAAAPRATPLQILPPGPSNSLPHSPLLSLPWHPEQNSQPRGIIEVNKCLSIKGAEDAINKPHAFEISTTDQNMYFIADSDKARCAALCCAALRCAAGLCWAAALLGRCSAGLLTCGEFRIVGLWVCWWLAVARSGPAGGQLAAGTVPTNSSCGLSRSGICKGAGQPRPSPAAPLV